MALLDKLLTRASEEVRDPEHHKEWAEKGFDKAIEESRSFVEGTVLDPTLDDVKATALDGLDRLVEHRDAMVTLGASGLRAAISMLAMGRLDDAAKEAALLQLRSSASWDEVSAAITTAAEAGNQARREFEAAKKEILGVLKDIGITAGKALLPVLLAVI